MQTGGILFIRMKTGLRLLASFILGVVLWEVFALTGNYFKDSFPFPPHSRGGNCG